MESMYTELALYGINNECAQTVTVFLLISEVFDGTVSLYINNIENEFELDIFIFAHDTTISCSGENARQTSNLLNRDLDKILQWSKM